MGIRTLQVDDLAKELEDLQEQKELGDELLDEERLADLLELEDELGDLRTGHAQYAQMIAARDFVEYAQEFAAEIGADSNDWPYDSIDWKAAAEDLAIDFSQVEFDGKDWLVRV
jgi:hypothetical protein